MATLAEKVRLRLNAVGDDFYPDEFIVDCLNKAQDHVVSTMINMEKVSAQMGSRKSLRALDSLRYSTELDNLTSFDSYETFYKFSFPLSTDLVQTIALPQAFTSFTLTKDSINSFGRELFDSELMLLINGNAVPTKKEFFFNLKNDFIEGGRVTESISFSGDINPTVSQTLSVSFTQYGETRTYTFDTITTETLHQFLKRVANQLESKKTLTGFTASAVTPRNNSSIGTISLKAIKYGTAFYDNVSVSITAPPSGDEVTFTFTPFSTAISDGSVGPTVTIFTKYDEYDSGTLEFILVPSYILITDSYLTELPKTFELPVIYKACSYALLKEEMGEKQIKASEQFEALFQREFQGVVQ